MALKLRYLAIIAALLFGECLAEKCWAADGTANGSDAPEPTKVELISDREILKPGSSFLVGAKFSIDKGWHIYGQNPGDAGLPTKIVLNLPLSFKVEETIWPKEQEFKQAGGIVSYGYTGDLLIVNRIKSDAGHTSTDPVVIEGMLSWLNCSEKLCIPVRKKLSLELKLGEEDKPSKYADDFKAVKNIEER